MTQFTINNSKIEQINDKGNNIKLISNSGNNAVTENGDIVQTTSAASATERLFIDDIESFSKVRDVAPAIVAGMLNGGYLDIAENTIQIALEQILGVPFHKVDCPNEFNDLYTANVLLNGSRCQTAFMLKGNGLKKKMMEIRDCGKNGDQVVRLFQSPADLFVIQFVGNISEAVIQHANGEIARLKTQGKEARLVTIDGQDTARLLYAYKKFVLPPFQL